MQTPSKKMTQCKGGFAKKIVKIKNENTKINETG